MTKAAIYARLSVDRDEDKLGIDAQLQDSRALAERNGWEIASDREYVDRGLTAADKLIVRPEYDRLVADFRARKFDVLICWDLDRLTRQPRQLEDWIDAAEESGLRVITANGEADLHTDAGQMFASMKVRMAKAEVRRASARIKRNVRARQEQGKWHGGAIPYGYMQTEKGKTLEPNPAEVEVIQEAVKRVLAGDTMYGVTAEFNRQGRTTRTGKGWRQSNLRPILLNRTMLGETTMRDADGKRVEGAKAEWPAIIDRRTFERVTNVLTDPARKSSQSPGVRGGKYSMGGGLTICASCGHRLITHGKRGRVALACLKRVFPQVVDRTTGEVIVEGACGSVTIDHDRLERFIFTSVINSLKNNPRVAQRMSEPTGDENAVLDRLEAQRDALNDQRERLGKAFVLGGFNEREYASEVARINAEVEEVDGKISAALGSTILTDAREDGFDWESWSPMRRRNFLAVNIKHIAVSPWPEGFTKNTPIRKGESEADWEVRREAYQISVIANRVDVVMD
jgi:site-specific DNA recombinase